MPPDVADWAFDKDNDCIFAEHGDSEYRMAPSEWLGRGAPDILKALRERSPSTSLDDCLDKSTASVLGLALCASPVQEMN